VKRAAVVLGALSLLTLAGCVAPGVEFRTDDPAAIEAVNDALDVWTRDVGELPALLIVGPATEDDPPGIDGRCSRRIGGTRAYAFSDRVSGAKLTFAALHELAHAALTCSSADHVDDRDSLLFPRNVGNSVNRIDPLTPAKIRAAM